MLQQTLFWLIASLTVAAATLSPPSVEQLNEKKLSRKKRWLAFPEGSSVAATMCLTIGVLGNPKTEYMSWGGNWGVAYDLPNHTWAKQNAHGFKNVIKNAKPIAQRRSRRDLYEKIELAIDSMGYNGHSCIGRALCESGQYFQNLRYRRGNMIEEIVRTIFSLPSTRVQSHEDHLIHKYDRMYRRSRREAADCSLQYPDCHFSLLDLALGKYSPLSVKHGPDLKSFLSFM